MSSLLICILKDCSSPHLKLPLEEERVVLSSAMFIFIISFYLLMIPASLYMLSNMKLF